MFRTRTASTPLDRLLPEVHHRYPTYRFDIARGRIARADKALIPELADQVQRIGAPWVFCPLGVGRHVDHLIVRAVGERLGGRVVYYADFPYVTTNEPDREFLDRHRLTRWSWAAPPQEKQALIRGYRTQAAGLFPDGRIPPLPESYYSPAG